MGRFLTLLTYLHSMAGPGVMLLYPLIPIWYDMKLAFVAWLVLPQFRGAAFIYEKFVREKLIKRYGGPHLQKSPNAKNKFVDFVSAKKAEQEAY
ncbi:hypothetical protein C2S52_021717 [Perilla frutescens var. hirtella]|uniref:HVA22-like protein n=1 Tax=Perilla frutescens var. hirtella TaxID=608512 RepID=A0AAD4JD70_PERFH|nr:hypothetical protein C2S52_021717 [Perilla frutescens var. hirtella]KAH6831577.1 hypothetical protein C2S53_018993 [Perilla frutescens var. hirtella]